MQELKKDKKASLESETGLIEMKDVCASWTNNHHCKTLIDLNIKCYPGKLTAIIGSVGGGKSSILQVLLGELELQSGDVTINGDISYASQEPWIFSSTIKNNIVFGQKYNKLRYQEIVKSCALLQDFQELPCGEETLCGERGSSLSGGQRARISLGD